MNETRTSQKQKTNIANFMSRVKVFFLGRHNKLGFLAKVIIYGLLIGIGFVYLYPLIYMGSYSFKSLDDLLNPLINWIPSEFYIDNYTKANRVINFLPTFFQTLYVTALPALIQTIVASMIGYGFARFKFPLHRTLFALVLVTFMIPPQVLMIPRYVFFNGLGLVGSIQSFLLPAAFGQGLNSAIFILIFYQFFRMLPTSLEEAAHLDGAGYYKIFVKIAIPMAVPAFIISFLFSFVWYWNDTMMAATYFGNELTTLPLELQRFSASFEQMGAADLGGSESKLNEGIKMAGTMLTILPLLIVYAFTQKWFVEGVDRTGITGE